MSLASPDEWFLYLRKSVGYAGISRQRDTTTGLITRRGGTVIKGGEYSDADRTAFRHDRDDIDAPLLGSLAKHAPGNLAAYRVLKSTNEQRFTLGVAYPAMKADVARAADGHRDFVSEEVLEKTAWEWLAKFRDVGLFHRDGTEGHFTPTESYIWRAPTWKVDSPVDGKPYLVCKGDWVLGGVWDDYGWTMVKSGLANGWSPEGGARRSTPTAERLALLRA